MSLQVLIMPLHICTGTLHFLLHGLPVNGVHLFIWVLKHVFASRASALGTCSVSFNVCDVGLIGMIYGCAHVSVYLSVYLLVFRNCTSL